MIYFDVRYYDQAEKVLIDASSYAQMASGLVEKGFALDEEEILAYTMFTNWRDLEGWRTFADWKRRMPKELGIFEKDFDLSGGTVRARFAEQNPSGIVESAGVGAALAAANRLFD